MRFSTVHAGIAQNERKDPIRKPEKEILVHDVERVRGSSSLPGIWNVKLSNAMKTRQFSALCLPQISTAKLISTTPQSLFNCSPGPPLLATNASLNLARASITVASRTRSLDPGKLNGPHAELPSGDAIPIKTVPTGFPS